MRNQEDFIEAEDRNQVREKIKRFDYEVDDQGRLYSTQDRVGYGVGWQMMPQKPGKSVQPLYKITHKGHCFVLYVKALVSRHFIPSVEFNPYWYEKTRAEAKAHNAKLRKQWLKDHGTGKVKGATAKMLAEARKVDEAKRKERRKLTPTLGVGSDFAPWANPFELASSGRIYERACGAGFDFRDSNIYPFL